MQIAKTPNIAKKVFPRLTWSKPSVKREVFLTFDDGPTPEVTEWVLSTLNSFNAKATFFCLGKNVVLFPDIFSEIIRAGHNVGNHTYNHVNAWKTSSENYLKDIKRCETVFHSKLFRPPYGKLKPGVRTKILKDYDIIMWDVLSYDFDPKVKPEVCTENVIKNLKPGSIIVFHDSKKANKNLKYALPLVLQHLENEGFEMNAL